MPPEKPAVLMVTGAYVPEMSGAGLQCRALVRALSDQVSFTILTTTMDDRLPAEDEQDGVPVYRVLVNPASTRSKLLAALRMIRLLLRLRGRFSIMHLHGFSQKSVLLVIMGLITGKHIAIKMTSVGHDDPVSMQARGRIWKWCYSRAHVLFGVSPRFQTLHESSGLSRERFRLIPNGVDVKRFSPLSPQERRVLRGTLGLPVEGALVLFVGFFSRDKCPDVLFDAWARCVSAGDRASVLLFVGATRSDYYEVDPRLAEDIRERAARLGVTSRVCFVEATAQIEDYQRAADIFVLPSVREGLPNALLEAMACGAGCVATRIEGVTDQLLAGDSGVLVPPRDVVALEGALTRLLADPEGTQAMGARARVRIVQDFAMAIAARRYLAVYQELLAS